MTRGAATLCQLLEVWDGEVVAPPGIEGVIASLESSGADRIVECLVAATRTDLGDIPLSLATLRDKPAEEILYLARRLGWTVKALVEWDPHQKRSAARIEAALASVSAWNRHGGFWEAMQSRLQGCCFMIPALETVLKHRAVLAQVHDDAPVWEREHLRALQEAERACNWAELGKRAQAFEQLPCPDLSAQQAILALSLLDWPRLVGLANKSEGWLHSHFLIAPLPLADALRIAMASGNGYARFAALERVAYREVRDLCPQEETALRNMLILLAKDAENWHLWLNLFNQFPVRHPHMQAALGRALARSDQPALHAYVASISLGTSDRDIRANVTRCMSIFRTHAGAVRRLTLWRAAFERWAAWDFAKDEGQHLTTLARSALDYGVVGWLVEGVPQRSLAEIERSFEDDLHASEMRWHSSLNSAISDFFRLVSRHQVLAQAARRSAGDSDWLPGPSIDLPAAATDEFLHRKYRWNDRQVSA